MPQISEILVESNPWWKITLSVSYHHRDIYDEIKKYLSTKQIIAFTGLRRVGKTTLMLKIIQEYLQRGTNPDNILYFSFDEFHDTEIREIIKEYQVIKQKQLTDGKYVFLFDEIQKVTNWEEQIKRIYDIYHKNIKIIISGSESLFIRKKSKESLAGRIFEFKIEPLSFKEFLVFKEITIKDEKIYDKELQMLFNEFILTQGLPELINVQDKEMIKKYIKESIIEKTIYNDIPLLFNVKDISVIRSIINIIMENPGQVIEINDLAKELSLSRQTLSLYLSYLEESFLIRKLYNYAKNRRKIERKLKKYYPTIIDTTLLFKEDILSQSKVFETVMVNQLNAEYFWRDPYKNEVDIVIDTNHKILPIEIKYGKIEFHGLYKFMEQFTCKEGCIISKNKQEEIQEHGKKISIIPAYKLLFKNILNI